MLLAKIMVLYILFLSSFFMNFDCREEAISLIVEAQFI